MITFGFIVCGILYIAGSVAMIGGMILEARMWSMEIDEKDMHKPTTLSEFYDMSKVAK